MRVVTWNLWWRFGPYGERQPAIAEVLRSLDADVVLLQEVYCHDGDDQAERLADGLGFHWVATTDHTGARHALGNAILSRWPITAWSQCRLPDLEGAPGHRSALRAELAGPDGLQPVATTHLEWPYDASALRQRQLETLVGWLAGHPADTDVEARLPLVFGGDLNAVPESDEVRRLVGLAPGYLPVGDRPREGTAARVFTDCWAAVGRGSGATWSRANPHASDALWPERRIDYVLVGWPRGKPAGNPRRASLAGTEPVDGVVASDHYAVVVDLDDRPADPGASHE